MIVFITGSSGFVGKSFIASFSDKKFIQWKRGNEINIDSASVVIHLAGKAHDLKNTSTPDEYYQVNTERTKKIFDSFLASDAKVFIALSSVKAVADEVQRELNEEPVSYTHLTLPTKRIV